MNAELVEFNVTDNAIAELKENLGGLVATDTDSYKLVRAGLKELRERRVAVETTRKALKADALAFGRKVDGEAKRITAALVEIETPLKAERDKWDDQKAAEKKAKEEAERMAIEEELKAKLAKEEEARKAEEEKRRIAIEQEQARMQLEKDRIAKEAAEVWEQQEKERKELQAEKAKLEAERKEIEAEKRKAEEEKRLAEEAKRKEEEKKRLDEALEAAKKQEEEDERLRLEYLESIKPDVERVQEFADRVSSMVFPEVKDESCEAALTQFKRSQMDAVSELRKWCCQNQLIEA